MLSDLKCSGDELHLENTVVATQKNDHRLEWRYGKACSAV